MSVLKESVTFRIGKSELEQLRHIAENSEISLNTLENQLVKSFLECEHPFARAGFISLQKDTVEEFLARISDEELKNIAIKAADRFMDKLFLIMGKTDLHSFLRVTKAELKRSGIAYREISDSDKGHFQFVIVHNMGSKWSTFFGMYNERIINNLGYGAKIEATESSLTIWASIVAASPSVPIVMKK